ncbi:MAG: RNA polymerase, sigma 70 subunit, RpoD subfamily [Parcubacteria group bacterium GW2011_GWA2_44_12]|nr:MAG: RNA polymerase, sigma 70 subunit, RpoD subfamily [Parcubacteria group bacterium GW2011_GWA2_44_12]
MVESEAPQPTEQTDQGNDQWRFLRSCKPILPPHEIQKLAQHIYQLRSKCRRILEEDIIPYLADGPKTLMDRIERSRQENSALEESVPLDAQTIPDHEKHKRGFTLYQLKNRSYLLEALPEVIASSADPDLAYTAYRKFILCDEEMTKEINILVEHNFRLVARCVMKFHIKDDDFFDYLHEGVIGFKEALERYDPHRGTKLSTHAVLWIKRNIGRAMERKGHTIRIPHYYSPLHAKIEEARRVAVQKFQCEDPTDEQIASILGVDTKIVEQHLKLPYTVSFETPLGNAHTPDDKTTLGDLIPDPHTRDCTNRIEQRIDTDALWGAFCDTLPKKFEKIARMWYEDGLTAQAIADEIGVTAQRINKIEQKIKEKFRHFIGAYENFCFLKAEREENEYRKN